MIMPLPNKKDLIDIPKKVLKTMEFIYVEDVKEVLSHALVAKADKRRQEPGTKAKKGRDKSKTKARRGERAL